jgi:hypothetical protein
MPRARASRVSVEAMRILAPRPPRGALLLLGGVFGLHLVLSRILGAYEAVPGLDLPMHIAGGTAIGLTVLWTLEAEVKAARLTQPPPWLEVLLTLGLTALAAVLWEFAEFTGDSLGWTHAQRGLRDTLTDLAMGLVGAVLALAARRRA